MFGPELIESIKTGGFFIPANMSFNEWKEFMKTIEHIDSAELDNYTKIQVYTGEGEVDVSNLKKDDLCNIEFDTDLSPYKDKYLIAYNDINEPKALAICEPIEKDEMLKARL
ncbi:hypothetical protein BX667DRAFT_508554 [Coemansia mojavensis]|nr:hypothetical protein BX667DRAFT_508554 [Coemansia mojavensis]